MRLYQYQCTDCDATFEYLIRNSESVPTCPCGSVNVAKLFSRSAIKLSRHFHNGKSTTSLPEQAPGGLVRMAKYADRNTGKFLGYGEPQVPLD